MYAKNLKKTYFMSAKPYSNNNEPEFTDQEIMTISK